MEETDKVHKIRHSAAHLLAQAVKQLYPEVKLGIGPVIENGFYYDFFRKEPFIPDDLKNISKRMKELLRKNIAIEEKKLDEDKIKDYLKSEPLKKELFDELVEQGEKPTFFQQEEFIDLCRGPHVPNTKDLKNFALTKVSGAYWKGDSSNIQLQRIYGVAFETEEELKEYLHRMEEAEKYNHSKIGEEMELFTIFNSIGKGLPIWLPKGEIIKEEIEKFAIETENKAGFVRVSTPLIAKKELFLRSGHLPHYADSMYPPMKMDDGEYYLKAMNCPMHHLIFSRKVRSYRELPLRIAEYGVCHRNELSGTLSGLQRVRMMKMNDAHIYCTKDQIEEEIEGVLAMVKYYYEVFGFKDYSFRLSLWDSKNKEKYIDEPENWEYSEEILRRVLKKLNLKFDEVKNEAAFYGPKIDVQLKNIYGKEETMSTVQLDFAAKKRFELHYDDAEGKQNNEVFVIHRAPLSTHERFIAFLIEACKGKFPLWLSPVQVKIVTVNDGNIEYAEKIMRLLKEKGIRVELDKRAESIGKKVRTAIIEKVNYIVTIGEQEISEDILSIRDREGKLEKQKIDYFISNLTEEIRKKC